MGGMGFSVYLDQIEHRIIHRRDSKCGRRHSRDGAAGSNGEQAPPGRIDGKCRRVCGWRAKHAVSLGHVE
jgi:hypothetical protein